MAAKAIGRALHGVLGVLLWGCSPPGGEEVAHGSLGVAAEIADCPAIEDLEAVPLEVVRTGEIEVNARLSFVDDAEHVWTATAGAFDDPSRLRTAYHCDIAGDQKLTFTLAEGSACEDAVQLRVTCSFSPGCGNGELDLGEECDDGNVSGGDGCSSRCMLKPRLADAGD